MEITASIQVPLSLLMAGAVKVLPPRIIFGSPVQRAKNEPESYWHVPITVQPRIFGKCGPATIPNCQVYLDLYEGQTLKNSIRLCWGDLQMEGPRENELLRKNHVSLVPVAWRTEEGDDRQGYFAETRFVRDTTKAHPILADRKKNFFKLRIKSGSFKRESPHFYIARCPSGVSNGHFVVEIIYEGEGTQGT